MSFTDQLQLFMYTNYSFHIHLSCNMYHTHCHDMCHVDTLHSPSFLDATPIYFFSGYHLFLMFSILVSEKTLILYRTSLFLPLMSLLLPRMSRLLQDILLLFPSGVTQSPKDVNPCPLDLNPSPQDITPSPHDVTPSP